MAAIALVMGHLQVVNGRSRVLRVRIHAGRLSESRAEEHRRIPRRGCHLWRAGRPDRARSQLRQKQFFLGRQSHDALEGMPADRQPPAGKSGTRSSTTSSSVAIASTARPASGSSDCNANPPSRGSGARGRSRASSDGLVSTGGVDEVVGPKATQAMAAATPAAARPAIAQMPVRRRWVETGEASCSCTARWRTTHAPADGSGGSARSQRALLAGESCAERSARRGPPGGRPATARLRRRASASSSPSA